MGWDVGRKRGLFVSCKLRRGGGVSCRGKEEIGGEGQQSGHILTIIDGITDRLFLSINPAVILSV